jgi:hypothetical protein
MARLGSSGLGQAWRGWSGLGMAGRGTASDMSEAVEIDLHAIASRWADEAGRLLAKVAGLPVDELELLALRRALADADNLTDDERDETARLALE